MTALETHARAGDEQARFRLTQAFVDAVGVDELTTERLRRALRTLYAREVQFTDFWVGKLLDQLKSRGFYDEAVIVVVSDHGEEFWEHGGFEHGHTVFPEVTGVPLFLRLPAAQQAGTVIATPVSTLDLLPTICDLASLEVPAGLPGRSLYRPDRPAALLGREQPRSPQILANLLYPPEQTGVLAWPWFWRYGEEDAAGTWYDLAADPGATRPVAAPAEAAAIRSVADSLLGAWEQRALLVREDNRAVDREVPAEVKRSLNALGY